MIYLLCFKFISVLFQFYFNCAGNITRTTSLCMLPQKCTRTWRWEPFRRTEIIRKWLDGSDSVVRVKWIWCRVAQ